MLKTSVVKNLCPKTLIVRLESLDLSSHLDTDVESENYTEGHQNKNKILRPKTLIIKLEPVASEFEDVLWETNEKSDVEVLVKVTRATKNSPNQDIVPNISIVNEQTSQKSTAKQETNGITGETSNNYRKLRNRSITINFSDETTQQKGKPIHALKLGKSPVINQSKTFKSCHICNFCQKTFQIYESLIRHTAKHTREKPIDCLLCDQLYSYVPGYVKPHDLTHDEKCLARKPFVCKICYKSFTTEPLQNTHHNKYHTNFTTQMKNPKSKYQKKNESKNLSCNFCGFSRSCWGDLVIHMRSHTKEKPYICKYCKKYFTSRRVLKRHKTIHGARNKSHLCETCGKAFLEAAYLLRHIRGVHGGKRIECQLCERTYSEKSSLNLHIKNFHEQYKPFKCNLCKFAATRNADLKKHMKSHTGERPFVCKDCGKTFQFRHSLTEHISGVHMGEKLFVCKHENCGQKFASKSSLKSHNTKHSNKTFLCQTCGVCFSTKASLKSHERKHSEEKPHLCHICGKGFTLNANLIRHGLIHSGQQSHLCHKCGRAFSLEANLKRHVGSLWCKRSEKFKPRIKSAH